MSEAGLFLVEEETLSNVTQWFSQFGVTDEKYLAAHWARYTKTRDFALSPIPSAARLDILDMGSHWLHNAFLYANRGHRMIGSDTTNPTTFPSVVKAAEAMKMDLRVTHRMELADSIAGLPDDSVDLVLFCEIIEHMAFNPIPFWKQVYRVLRPGGRIIVTTPNSMYHRSISERMNRMLTGNGYGPRINEIMANGTYGHHWKEFSLPELQSYFAFLSPDFDTSRYQYITHDIDVSAPLGSLESHISQFVEVRAHNIYLDVSLPEKKAGIQVSPPWIPA